ncbi:hypothetical protein VHARVF571_200165 [Vibrio harveyi]|nr:hypothetical protein VHARVF571_200165 [Vibrio harveyi]
MNVLFESLSTDAEKVPHQENADREVLLIYYLLTNDAGLLCTNSDTCTPNQKER